MVNKKLFEFAKRHGNDEVPSETREYDNSPIQQSVSVPVKNNFPDKVDRPFLLEYDDFGMELITKSNERFKGTDAEIPMENKGIFRRSRVKVKNMYLLRRLALVTTIANDSQLRNNNVWPITPLQSEYLLQSGKLTGSEGYWEDLGLILYDIRGPNKDEVLSLYESLELHERDLGLSDKDLEGTLLVVNAGLEVDSSMPHGVKPVTIPGVTGVYQPEILQRNGGNYRFDYGLDNGLPNPDLPGSGKREIFMPNLDYDLGLHVLVRRGGSNLGVSIYLANSELDGRINFAQQECAL